jgi:recombination protein RecA
MAKKKKEAVKVSTAFDIRKMINKKAGMNVAFNLDKDENPTEVKGWIPTGSKWLDNVIASGRVGGIPIGKIVELAGLESVGKSYMAAQIAANALEQGMDVIYFDSESAIDPDFLEQIGCDLEKLVYVQATSCEFVLETIEDVLGSSPNRTLFVFDSLAQTPTNSDMTGTFNPAEDVAVKARVMSKGLRKLLIPIANHESTLLVLNQLKINIDSSINMKYATIKEKYFTPGGKSLTYAYSLRIWLEGRAAKSSFVEDDNGFRIGSEVKATIIKSRFGTQWRQAIFKILWGGDKLAVQDEESWFEAIRSSEHFHPGAWNTLDYADGTNSGKWRQSEWIEKLKEEKFYNRVVELLDEELIYKFAHKTGKASDFYDVEGNNNGIPIKDE